MSKHEEPFCESLSMQTSFVAFIKSEHSLNLIVILFIASFNADLKSDPFIYVGCCGMFLW